MTPEHILPDGFHDLEGFVDYWVRDTVHDRLQQRSRASMDEIRRFYDAMLARAEDAISYLDGFPLDSMPQKETVLFKLLLALGQVAIAVEMHGQPRARHSTYPNNIVVTNGPRPHGGSGLPRAFANVERL